MLDNQINIWTEESIFAVTAETIFALLFREYRSDGIALGVSDEALVNQITQ